MALFKQPAPDPPYECIFDLMKEHSVMQVLELSAAHGLFSFPSTMLELLAKGLTLKELMPKAWQPGGNALGGGYGIAARKLPHGLYEVLLTVGRFGEAHELYLLVELGPLGDVLYWEEKGFSMN